MNGESERAIALIRPAMQELSAVYGPCHPANVNLRSVLADSEVSMARFAEASANIAGVEVCATAESPQYRTSLLVTRATRHALRGDLEQVRVDTAAGRALAALNAETELWLDDLELIGAEAELRRGAGRR